MPKRFSKDQLLCFFPKERADSFFEALYGDAEDGAYDIELVLDESLTSADIECELRFFFHLHERQGHCLACNLTTGLPHVFERHPVLGLQNLCIALASHAEWPLDDVWWRIGTTENVSEKLHRLPLTLLKNRS